MKSLRSPFLAMVALCSFGCAEGSGTADDPDGVVIFDPDAVLVIAEDSSRSPFLDRGTVVDAPATDAGRTDIDVVVLRDAATSDVGVAPRDVPSSAVDTGPSCALPREACAGACVDLDTSVAHCGACGHACGAGASCVGGVCQTPCVAPRMTCAGTCLDVSTDVTNCGACGRRCTTGQTCTAGVCTTPTAPGSALGQACTTSAQCGAGDCATGWPGGYCISPCRTTSDCGADGICVQDIDYIFCARACTSTSQCRTGYYCRDVGVRTAGVCYPI